MAETTRQPPLDGGEPDYFEMVLVGRNGRRYAPAKCEMVNCGPCASSEQARQLGIEHESKHEGRTVQVWFGPLNEAGKQYANSNFWRIFDNVLNGSRYLRNPVLAYDGLVEWGDEKFSQESR